MVAPPPGWSERLAKVAPRATWQRVDAESVSAHLASADIAVGNISPRLLASAPRLGWLQLMSAGADRYVLADELPPGLVITTASGVFGIPIAEHVLGMVLALLRGLHANVRSQANRVWHREKAHELFGRRVGILGMGDIGIEVARRMKPFGTQVIGFKRNPAPTPPFVDALYDEGGLDRIVREVDVLVVALPLTPQTHHILSRERLQAMRPGSIIVNVGRGALIDEAALVDVLRVGPVAAAGLDVFVEEPLPKESPLWEMPNVIVSPHSAGSTPAQVERVFEIFADNLARYAAGQPLRNTVDRSAGY